MLRMHTAVQLWLSSYNKQEQLRASWTGLLLTLLVYFTHFVIIHVKNAVMLAPGIQTQSPLLVCCLQLEHSARTDLVQEAQGFSDPEFRLIESML